MILPRKQDPGEILTDGYIKYYIIFELLFQQFSEILDNEKAEAPKGASAKLFDYFLVTIEVIEAGSPE